MLFTARHLASTNKGQGRLRHAYPHALMSEAEAPSMNWCAQTVASAVLKAGGGTEPRMGTSAPVLGTARSSSGHVACVRRSAAANAAQGDAVDDDLTFWPDSLLQIHACSTSLAMPRLGPASTLTLARSFAGDFKGTTPQFALQTRAGTQPVGGAARPLSLIRALPPSFSMAAARTTQSPELLSCRRCTPTSPCYYCGMALELCHDLPR